MADGGLDLTRFRRELGREGVAIGAKRIEARDEWALLPEEAASVGGGPARRRASGAARLVARGLLRGLGFGAAVPIPRAPGGAPIWPAKAVGSLSHDDVYAVAAVAPMARVASLGIDVEPALALPEDLFDLVLGPDGRRHVEGDATLARLVFCAKEAVYKAIYALDGTMLEFGDIEVSLADERALLRDSRQIQVRAWRGAALVAVAFAGA